MDLWELSALSVGLSMDAFAAAVCAGLTMRKATLIKALTVGLYFGVFQAFMPFIGYLAATFFADRFITYSHWVAFGLLVFLGGIAIFESFKKEDFQKEYSLKPAHMLPLALATSIDALAVGASFAFLQVNILTAVLFIGTAALVISMAGVKIGNVFGARFN
jgi:putative Mn2+ efflux pump MntP